MGQFTPIYAAAIDGVLLDACGAVDPGAASYFAMTNTDAGVDAFIRCRLTPEYFTPQAQTLENGRGRRVVDNQGTPQLQRYGVRLEIAGLVPAIAGAIHGDRVLKTDTGNPTHGTGVVTGVPTGDGPGWALRLWEDVDNDICDGSGIPSVVHWIAAARKWQYAGDYTLESGARVTVLEGKAERNAQFGDGPFDDAGGSDWADNEIYGYDLAFDVTLPTDTAGEVVAWPIV